MFFFVGWLCAWVLLHEIACVCVCVFLFDVVSVCVVVDRGALFVLRFFFVSVCWLFFVLCWGWRVVVGVESCSGRHCDVVGVVSWALAYEMGKCGNSLLLSSTGRLWCGGCENPILFYFGFESVSGEELR